MEEGKCFIGLEIGSSKIAAVAGLQENKKIKILGFSEKQISPADDIMKFGVIENGEVTSGIISEVLDEIVTNFEKSGFEFDIDSVNINITNLSIKSHQKGTNVVSSGGVNKISQGDVNRLVNDANNAFKPHPGHTVIHSLPKDFYVNDEKTNGTLAGKYGNQLKGDFTFITSKTESLENLMECVNHIPAKGAAKGFMKIDNIYLNTVADSYALLNNAIDDTEIRRDGVAIVNIGADFTQVSVFHNNSLRYQSVIPIAGNTINLDLMKAFNIKFEEAEILKKVAGGFPPVLYEESPVVVIEKMYGMQAQEIFLKNALTIVESRLKEIAVIVRAEIAKSGYKNQLLNGIILTGGTSNFSFIQSLFDHVSKDLNVRVSTYNKAIDFNNFDTLKNARYSTLLGLVVAPAFDFDKRIDNRILTPKSIQFKTSPPVAPIKVPTIEVDEEHEEKSGGIFAKLGEMFKKSAIDLNDDYNSRPK